MPRAAPCWFATLINASPVAPENAVIGVLSKSDTASRSRIEESRAFKVRLVIDNSLNSKLQPMTAIHYCATINESYRSSRRVAKGDLRIFKCRPALNASFIAARCVSSPQTRASVCIVLKSNARANRVRSAGADETRVVDAQDDYDAIAHDPFVDRANGKLTGSVHSS